MATPETRLLEKESEMRAKNKLKQGPAEREKSRKKGGKEPKDSEANETSSNDILHMQCKPHHNRKYSESTSIYNTPFGNLSFIQNILAKLPIYPDICYTCIRGSWKIRK